MPMSDGAHLGARVRVYLRRLVAMSMSTRVHVYSVCTCHVFRLCEWVCVCTKTCVCVQERHTHVGEPELTRGFTCETQQRSPQNLRSGQRKAQARRRLSAPGQASNRAPSAGGARDPSAGRGSAASEGCSRRGPQPTRLRSQ